MIQLKYILLVFTLTSFSMIQAYASVCLRAETIQDLKKDFPIVVVGEVLKKDTSESATGFVKMDISIVKALKGKIDISTISGYSIERFSEEERPLYKVGKHYVFPIKVSKDPKGNKQYEIEIPSQGCKLFPYQDDRK